MALKSLHFFILIKIFFIVTNAEDPIIFRKDYTLIVNNNAFYKEHKNKVHWVDAVAKCNAEGAELVVPTSKNEIDEIFKFLNSNTIQFWVGIHDKFSEGVFTTTDGVSIDNLYIDWNPEEPNNAFGDEDCVAVHTGLKTYNDLGCEQDLRFVCKRDVSTLKKNRYCDTYDMDYFPSKVTGRCYKLHKTPTTWNDAFGICKSELSELAVINSEDEAKMLVEMLEMHPGENVYRNFDKSQIHVGFNDILKYGEFRTIDGKLLSESGYEKWSFGQPNYRNSEHCGAMFRDGTLNDIQCSLYAMYFCEKILD